MEGGRLACYFLLPTILKTVIHSSVDRLYYVAFSLLFSYLFVYFASSSWFIRIFFLLDLISGYPYDPDKWMGDGGLGSLEDVN